MRSHPGTTRWEHTPRGTVHRTCNPPDVCIVMSHPTLAVVHLLCSLRTRLTQVFYHREERFLCLSQIAYQCRPVVHLGIDIDGVFRIPWGIHLVVPHTLQVGSLSSRLTRRNQQVTSVLHHQCHHIQVTCILLEGCYTLVCLQT